MLAPAAGELVEVGEGQHVLEPRLPADALDPGVHLLVLADDPDCLRMAEDIGAVDGRARRVDGDDRHADLREREVDERPLEPRVAEDRERVPLAEARRRGSRARARRRAAQRPPRQRAPSPSRPGRDRRGGFVRPSQPAARARESCASSPWGARRPPCSNSRGIAVVSANTPGPPRLLRSCGRSGKAQSASASSTSRSGWRWPRSARTSRSERCTASAARRSSRSAGVPSTIVKCRPTSSSRAGSSRRASTCPSRRPTSRRSRYSARSRSTSCASSS